MATKEILTTLDQVASGDRIALKLSFSDIILRGSVVSKKGQTITVNNGILELPVSYNHITNIVNWGNR